MSGFKRFLKLLFAGWMKFARILGRINSFILLTVFYFTLIGLTRLFSWITRQDPLDSKWKDRASYWKKRTDFKIEKEPFLKPY